MSLVGVTELVVGGLKSVELLQQQCSAMRSLLQCVVVLGLVCRATGQFFGITQSPGDNFITTGAVVDPKSTAPPFAVAK